MRPFVKRRAYHVLNLTLVTFMKLSLKACLHLQFLLRFLVCFFSSDGCEQVDEL